MRRTDQERKAGETWVAVADVLGVSVRSLHAWRRIEGAPERPDAEAWRTFIEQHGLNKGMSKALAKLKVLIAEEELKKKRRENARQEGALIGIDAVRGYLARLSTSWGQLLTLKIETEIPARLVGKEIVAARAEARAVLDEIRDVCNAGIVNAEAELTPRGTS